MINNYITTAKRELRSQLNQDTHFFLANGGKVRVIPTDNWTDTGTIWDRDSIKRKRGLDS